jgi:Zn-finger protein
MKPWVNILDYLNNEKDDPLGWCKVVKHKISAWYAVEVDNQPPPFIVSCLYDNPYILLGGRWIRWYRLFKLNSCEDCLFEFRNTILQGVKRGCPRVTDSVLRAEERRTFTVLTQPYSGGELGKYSKTLIADAINRTVDEVFVRTM